MQFISEAANRQGGKKNERSEHMRATKNGTKSAGRYTGTNARGALRGCTGENTARERGRGEREKTGRDQCH